MGYFLKLAIKHFLFGISQISLKMKIIVEIALQPLRLDSWHPFLSVYFKEEKTRDVSQYGECVWV